MTYEEAKRRARKVFGLNGHVVVKTHSVMGDVFHVGTYISNGKFSILGVGTSWEAAFEDAEKRAKSGTP